MRITFLGAAGTVTGSKLLVTSGRTRLLIDCGLFQGIKQLRLRNWQPLPFGPAALDAVVLTHGHLDHSGYLPRLVKGGFGGPVWATAPTLALSSLLLADAGRIQEEDAAYANRRGFSKHHPALPLYTEADARRVERHLQGLAFARELRIGELTVQLVGAGHLLGAASVLIRDDDGTRLLVSGDLGRQSDVLVPPPAARPAADWVVMESTYGDREHPDVDPLDELEELVRRVTGRGGTLLVPSFAVGRTQSLLVTLERLFTARPELRVPVFVDSPMARSATAIYERFPDQHRLRADELARSIGSARFAGSVEESKALDRRRGPMVLISASGMLTGGRILHHLKRYGPEARNAVLLAGFQAPGTRGAQLAAGSRALKVHGGYVPIAAEVVQLRTLSSHADRRELVQWLVDGEPPRRVFLVHGEPEAADALRRVIAERMALPVTVAEHGVEVELSMRPAAGDRTVPHRPAA